MSTYTLAQDLNLSHLGELHRVHSVVVSQAASLYTIEKVENGITHAKVKEGISKQTIATILAVLYKTKNIVCDINTLLPETAKFDDIWNLLKTNLHRLSPVFLEKCCSIVEGVKFISKESIKLEEKDLTYLSWLFGRYVWKHYSNIEDFDRKVIVGFLKMVPDSCRKKFFGMWAVAYYIRGNSEQIIRAVADDLSYQSHFGNILSLCVHHSRIANVLNTNLASFDTQMNETHMHTLRQSLDQQNRIIAQTEQEKQLLVSRHQAQTLQHQKEMSFQVTRTKSLEQLVLQQKEKISQLEKEKQELLSRVTPKRVRASSGPKKIATTTTSVSVERISNVIGNGVENAKSVSGLENAKSVSGLENAKSVSGLDTQVLGAKQIEKSFPPAELTIKRAGDFAASQQEKRAKIADTPTTIQLDDSTD